MEIGRDLAGPQARTGTATSGSIVGGNVTVRHFVDVRRAAAPSWFRRDPHGRQGSHEMHGDRS